MISEADYAEVSRKEEALWLLESLAPGTPVNNRSAAFTVAGELDPDRLAAALAVVLGRHDALRSVYRADGMRLVKRVLSPGEFTLGEAPYDAGTPFEFNGGPMLRTALAGDTFHVTAHELVLDGLSAGVFLEEIAAAYSHEALAPVAALVELPPRTPSLEFWRTRLAGATVDGSELKCAAPEPDRPTLAAAQVSRALPEHVVTGVRRLGSDLGVPESAILLAGYYALLAAHGADPDLVLGSPVDVRPAESARAIGYHVNYVPLRVRIDRAESVRDLILRSADTLRTAVAHADVPVDAYPDLLPRPRSARRTTPFRYAFEVLPGTGRAEFPIGGMQARRVEVEPGFSKFDLDLRVTVTGTAAEVRAVYRSELFDAADATLLIARYEAVLASFASGPGVLVGDVPVWSPRDREVIDAANNTDRPVQPGSVLHAVQDRVTGQPGAVAVIDGDQRVSYRQLWNAAHHLASLIRAAGVEPGDVVAVALPRSAELAAAVLGAWLAGAAYLPIDAAHPEERIRYQLADSGAKILLATADLARYAADDRTVLTPPPVTDVPDPATSAAPPVDPAACAYLIYTSGSTGRPKGTLVSHGALANLIAHFTGELAATAADTMLWLTTFAFDISGLELFVPLASGGSLVPAPDSARSDGRVLRDLVLRHDVRFVQATPTTWRLVIDRAGESLRGRTVLAGGEIVPVWLAQRLAAAGAAFHHVYGPTETTIWSTSRIVTDTSGARLDVGAPIANTQVFVVDEHGDDLPIGVRGELCIAGVGVAIGYHNRPELTAQRFGEHPRYGRFYRTGDVARWRADGVLDLFGRSDRQVKLRGNRIELGEIEATLLAHPQVGAAAVVMIGDPSADAVLIGCLEAAASTLDLDSVRSHARAQLSRSMLPGDLVTVEAMPINGSGKVDYPALERLVAERRAQAVSAPLELSGAGLDDELTGRLTTLWGTILQREDITADTNFFESGGNSMLAAWALQELQNLSGVSLGLGEIFEQPTPRGLATRVQDLLTAPAGR
ncbi:non-ribosomal peptide synthetase [Winogradskya humida]|uniref:Carrier domain-containing protein n=1 Tax=Winogradskya humida TaxID=113566 RepID=A0ABQ4A5K3_9ACTN|nr:amino acid adenylation domain-containing protein [Actinoplanes humidus]GIE26132.1 hypothetical protein Ahu01nite_092340 [Actinoplanes humidus]